nr:ALPV-099 [Albatrosspox virus]
MVFIFIYYRSRYYFWVRVILNTCIVYHRSN